MKNLLKISIIVIFIGISCFIFIKYQPKKEAPTTAIKPIVHTPDPIQNEGLRRQWVLVEK
jgi:predicted membrane protein